MKIEFTKDDLDYLALKVAEHIQVSNVAPVDESVAGKQIRDIWMSNRLHNLFRFVDFDKKTLREIARVEKYQWKKVWRFGDKCIEELEMLIKSAGLDFGDMLLSKTSSGYEIIPK